MPQGTCSVQCFKGKALASCSALDYCSWISCFTLFIAADFFIVSFPDNKTHCCNTDTNQKKKDHFTLVMFWLCWWTSWWPLVLSAWGKQGAQTCRRWGAQLWPPCTTDRSWFWLACHQPQGRGRYTVPFWARFQGRHGWIGLQIRHTVGSGFLVQLYWLQEHLPWSLPAHKHILAPYADSWLAQYKEKWCQNIN